MVFYETEVFTRQITELIDDESYWELQQTLITDPEAGALIPTSKGLRKIRWRATGRGKRGGIRAIYYLVRREEIFMLFAYSKSEAEDLTHAQLTKLRELVEEHLESS